MAASRAAAALGLAFHLAGRAAADGQYGCGVVVGADWPDSGNFNPPFRYDLTALMHSAERMAGRKVWHYDWSSTQAAGQPYNDWTYVAMDWCPGKPQPDPHGPWPGMLGWNEPDNGGQCNHRNGDVGEFVALANRYKALGKFVVSPAVTAGGNAWMDGFLGALHDNHFFGVDYLAYHHYVACNPGDADGYPVTSEQDIYNQLQGVLLNFKGLMDKWNGLGFHIQGLWLTEVSCGIVNGHWTGNCGRTCIQNTMRALIALVQNHPELKSWGWFSYNNFGNLFFNDPSHGYQLTDIGQWYFGNCNHRAAVARNESRNESVVVVV